MELGRRQRRQIAWSLAALLSAGACSRADRSVEQLRVDVKRAFPRQAAHVLGDTDATLATHDDTTLSYNGASFARFPEGGEGDVQLESADGWRQVIRGSTQGRQRVRQGNRVLSAGDHASSIWMTLPNGYEEWLYLPADASRDAEQPLAIWAVPDATVRSTGEDSAEILDGDGRLRWRVQASSAYAAGDRALALRLVVEGQELRLFLAPQDHGVIQGELLIDPSWTTGPTMPVRRQEHTGALLP
ncbi:MAG: hypothetical protein ACT4TC_25025, partial [Myxococcaceae bacterium]